MFTFSAQRFAKSNQTKCASSFWSWIIGNTTQHEHGAGMKSQKRCSLTPFFLLPFPWNHLAFFAEILRSFLTRRQSTLASNISVSRVRPILNPFFLQHESLKCAHGGRSRCEWSLGNSSGMLRLWKAVTKSLIQLSASSFLFMESKESHEIPCSMPASWQRDVEFEGKWRTCMIQEWRDGGKIELWLLHSLLSPWESLAFSKIPWSTVHRFRFCWGHSDSYRLHLPCNLTAKLQKMHRAWVYTALLSRH